MSARKLGLWSGVGLVMADMVGAGVLTTSGFMALELSPGYILLDWLTGGLIALAGALAYAALARQVPRSGGEYRYLSTLVHPVVGYFAGWTSLLVGFSVPVALAALAAGAFAETVTSAVSARAVAGIIILATTAAHAANLETSKWTQNVLAVVKAVLLVGFIAIGLGVGSNALPVWDTQTAVAAGFPVRPFFVSLIFISFCYTGWNAATYASEEFENPRRDVPRAMVIGCVCVTVLYLLVNWVLVTNLTRADMTGWIRGDTDRITLAHLVMVKLIGDDGARVMSVMVVLALMSAVSAMTLIGPRVYAAMAGDGFLPRILAARTGKPPVGSVVMQGGLALALVYMSGFRELLNNVSSVLAVVAALTVLSLFRTSRWRSDERPGPLALVSALVFATMSGWMVYFAIASSKTIALGGVEVPTVILWMLAIAGAAAIAFAATRRFAGIPASEMAANDAASERAA